MNAQYKILSSSEVQAATSVDVKGTIALAVLLFATCGFVAGILTLL